VTDDYLQGKIPMSKTKHHTTAADIMAVTLFDQGVTQVFGITGAGNIQIFDALARHGGFNFVFTHHEQAAVMAANTYYRSTGKLALALVTTGGGSTNALTGVVSSNMDSIPVLVIAGNEPSRYTTEENKLRIWGIQGFDSVEVMTPISKFSTRITNSLKVAETLNTAISVATSGKQGVSWVEVPLDLQSMRVVAQDYTKIEQSLSPTATSQQISSVVNALKNSKRPLLWLGYGIKSAQAQDILKTFLQIHRIPFLLSWAGSDLVDNEHELYMGKAGVYGQRHANLILQAADYVLAIGTRLAIPQIGYSLEELAPEARIDLVDIDQTEVRKLGERSTEAINADAGKFLSKLTDEIPRNLESNYSNWLDHIRKVKAKFPLIASEHEDTNGYMNSYRVIDRLNNYLKDNSITVTDMGTALLSGFYGLNLKENQKLMTSTGLGEMGFGLPAAVGAAIGNPDKEVICLNADGGMMMNLQELQTIAHHKLNIKIFIFNNDGYLMIKRSQLALLEGRFVGVDANSGLTCPEFDKVSAAFNIPYFRLRNWEDFDNGFGDFLTHTGPGIVEIYMDPVQGFFPRLMTTASPSGSLVSPPLEDLSPLISIEDLEWALQRKASPRSYQLRGLN
jgi:acetolactate synthase I/II/III large subunit